MNDFEFLSMKTSHSSLENSFSELYSCKVKIEDIENSLKNSHMVA